MSDLEMSQSISPASAMRSRAGGFTLLEILVALTLGLLLSAGILTLFSSTSQTNRLQAGLAHLQENGRFAVSRVEGDLRVMGAQYCSNFSGGSKQGTVVPVIPLRAPEVFASFLGLKDPGPDQTGGSLSAMNSVGPTGYPSAAPATAAYPLSPRYFVQGYFCDTASDCTSGLPAGLPAQGLGVGNRLPASDVLTVRYQSGTGWPVTSGTCAAGGTLTLTPQNGDDPRGGTTPPAIMNPGLALVTDCINSSILPIATVAGDQLTVGPLLAGATPTCTNPGNRDMRAFNFSKDFVTVTYFVQLTADLNAGARPNSGAAQRLIPVLMRRFNDESQELVQGVDALRFRYGVQDSGGNTRFLTADQVTASNALCPPPPSGVATEPGCLWRAVRTVEVHMLVNTVDEVSGLDVASHQYRFDDDPMTTGITDATVLPSGLTAGSMLRREFVAYVSNRNYNF